MLRSVVTTISDPLFRWSGSTPSISTDSPPPPSPPLGRSESSPCRHLRIKTRPALGEVDTNFICFCLKKPRTVNQEANQHPGQDVEERPGVIRLNLSEVMGPTHSYESFNAHPHQEVDADAEGNSVEGIVDVGKYMEEMNRIELSETISDRVHAGKYQVEAVTNVDGDQNKVEAVPHFFP